MRTNRIRQSARLGKGYVSHVCNEHRFKAGESRTLFFRFNDGVIESDKVKLQQREMREQEIKERGNIQFSSTKTSFKADAPVSSEDYDDLKLQISRMSKMLSNVSVLLDDSKAKILVLETTIRSLTLLLGFLAYVTLSLVLFNMTSFGLEVSIELAEKPIRRASEDDYTGQQAIMIKAFVLFFLATGGALLTAFLLPIKAIKRAERFEVTLIIFTFIIDKLSNLFFSMCISIFSYSTRFP